MITRRSLAALAAGSLMLPAGLRAQGAATPMPSPGKRAWAAQVPQIRIGLLDRCDPRRARRDHAGDDAGLDRPRAPALPAGSDRLGG